MCATSLLQSQNQSWRETGDFPTNHWSPRSISSSRTLTASSTTFLSRATRSGTAPKCPPNRHLVRFTSTTSISVLSFNFSIFLNSLGRFSAMSVAIPTLNFGSCFKYISLKSRFSSATLDRSLIKQLISSSVLRRNIVVLVPNHKLMVSLVTSAVAVLIVLLP